MQVQDYCRTCPVCQTAKATHKKQLGLHKPLHIPQWAGQSVSLDFIVDLPRCSRPTVFRPVTAALSRASYRPIMLLNTEYRLLTKVLDMRLGPALVSAVGPHQNVSLLMGGGLVTT
eukprot:351002-Chlamydomonas_euryale.AAC.29